jgi:hypothetical protein
MKWQEIDENEYKDADGNIIKERIERCKVPYGWLVKMILYSTNVKTVSYQGGRSGGIGVGVGTGGGITFVKDPSHLWQIKK